MLTLEEKLLTSEITKSLDEDYTKADFCKSKKELLY